MTTFLVEFPAQYQNPAQERECVRDRFGKWTIDGCPMPEPKSIRATWYRRLVCAPSPIVDAMR